MNTLPIEYNKDLPLAVISDNPLTFLQLGRLFNDFTIITSRKLQWHEQNLTSAKFKILSMKGPGNPSNIVRSAKLAEYAKSNPKALYLTYTPIDPPYKINPLSLVMNSPTLTHAYENKRYFRDEFADVIKMPDYVIKHVSQLDKAAAYRELKEEYGVFVMQDEESAGSKGTFIIHTYEDYAFAVSTLKKKARGRSVVVSKFIDGINASVQVCITKYGIFSGGLQYQLIAEKELCNPDLDGATAWTGGEVGARASEFLQHQAHEMATIVGKELESHGYKGIFGIDLMISKESEVFAIEINARLTGYSHIVNDLQIQNGQIPFMLLHVLEIANIPYKIKDFDALPRYASYKKPVSYMIVNNTLDEDLTLQKEIRPGIYRFNGSKIEFYKEGSSLDCLKNEDYFFLFTNKEKGETVGRGKRIANIMRYGPVFTSKQQLTQKNISLIRAIKKHFALPQ